MSDTSSLRSYYIIVFYIFLYISDIHSEPASGVHRQTSSSGSESSASAGADGGNVGVVDPPIAAAQPPPPVASPILPGLGFHKGYDFSTGAGLGYLANLLPGLGFAGGVPPVGGDPAADGGAGGGYLGMPWFFSPSYIPQTWTGSALAAKGDLIFPVVIFLFVIVGVITVVKFLLALLIPLVAKKFALADSVFQKKFRRSVPTDPKTAHQVKVDDLTHKVLPATGAHHDRDSDNDNDNDNDSDDDDF